MRLSYVQDTGSSPVDPDAYYGDMQSDDIIMVRYGDDATFKNQLLRQMEKDIFRL